MIAHALTFLRLCMIGKWRQNNSKPLLPQVKLFGMIPLETKQWAHARLRKHGNDGPTGTRTDKSPTDNNRDITHTDPNDEPIQDPCVST